MKACPAMITCAVRSVCNPRIGLESVFELAVIGFDRIVRSQAFGISSSRMAG
jgi:hypothetical protein